MCLDFIFLLIYFFPRKIGGHPSEKFLMNPLGFTLITIKGAIL